jgi:hypothetical protein
MGAHIFIHRIALNTRLRMHHCACIRLPSSQPRCPTWLAPAKRSQRAATPPVALRPVWRERRGRLRVGQCVSGAAPLERGKAAVAEQRAAERAVRGCGQSEGLCEPSGDQGRAFGSPRVNALASPQLRHRIEKGKAEGPGRREEGCSGRAHLSHASRNAPRASASVPRCFRCAVRSALQGIGAGKALKADYVSSERSHGAGRRLYSESKVGPRHADARRRHACYPQHSPADPHRNSEHDIFLYARHPLVGWDKWAAPPSGKSRVNAAGRNPPRQRF